MTTYTVNAASIAQFLHNAYLGRDIRTPFYDGPFGTRDIDKECGYPDHIDILDYIKFYERGDIAARINDIEPNECWKEYPNIYETEEERETEFEKAVDAVVSKTNLYSYLLRVDRISGIGRFGVLFLGFDDGEDFSEPAPGFSESEQLEERGTAKILYYRVFDESAATVSEYETDKTSPRYQLPKYYNLTFVTDPLIGGYSSSGASLSAPGEQIRVHWSRIIHVADNLSTSEIFGQPRLQNVFNRLIDLRKIYAGSAEMFWKGGFPGYSFEIDPTAGELTEEARTELKADVQKYAEGLQRYLVTVGVKANSLTPQIADPKGHCDNLLRVIATTKGIPVQFLLGADSGNVSSVQNAKTWAERVAFRRHMYLTPHIIRPTIDRLIHCGALPVPNLEGKNGQYVVKWVPLATLTETERAQVGKDLTEALARYATAGAEALIPLPEFLGKFLGFSYQQVESIMNAPETQRSVVIQQLLMLGAGGAGDTGSANGNVPTSVPNMAKTRDPNKTPTNVVQRATPKKGGASAPPAAQG